MTISVSENIRDVNPWSGSPTEGVAHDVDVKHSSHSSGSGSDCWGVGNGRVGLQQGTDYVEECTHSAGREDKGGTTSYSVKTEDDEDERSDDFDDTINTGGEEGSVLTRVSDLYGR
jgi:hypothetical protein